ncbi:MAG: PhoH-like ATPase [Verrucomicrobia bacterium]|jgi:PhoH-like ATPase|nr:MAG: PhoH-like ATPase [Verrucomicrobiota bacterium]
MSSRTLDPAEPVSNESSNGLFSPADLPESKPLRRKKEPASGLRAPSAHGKNFVLDTNVLIHDPHCIERFEDNHVCIPVEVLSELDRFKNEQTDRGASARVVHRILTEVFEGCPDAITKGVPTSGGGTLRLVVADPAHPTARQRLARFYRVFPNETQVDHRILACTLLVAEENASPTILVTKDLNMQLKGRAIGLICEDYKNDKVKPSEVHSTGVPLIEVCSTELQRFASTGIIEIDAARLPHLVTNEYVLLSAGEKRTMPARFNSSGQFIRLNVPDALRNPKGVRLKSMNLGQHCLLDALLDPTISLVTCFGAAGTGKTLLAVAAGLHCVFERTYTGMTISRPVVPMGDSVGYLPGDLEEKMRPWLQPIYDALDYLLPPANPAKKGTKQPNPQERVRSPYEELIDSKMIEIEALCYIRGRSIPNRFFILDEAQQMSPLEAKTVVTRMSKGAKLVMIGDPEQIDNPYVDSRSNGLVYTRRRLRGLGIAAHISLEKGERSDLAEAGAKLM